MANALGKGLSALIAETPKTASATPVKEWKDGEVRLIAIHQIKPGKFQARQRFNEEELQALADSIRTNGVVQPILVRQSANNEGQFEIVAGERRWRASKMAGLQEVPAIIRSFDDKKTMEIGLIENIQRENLNVLEEAEGYQRLLQEFNYTQEDLSSVLGRSRSAISNTIRLLHLPEEVKELVRQEQLSSGHARALLSASNPVETAQLVVKKALNVRQTEKLVKQDNAETAPKKSTPRTAKGEAKDPDIIDLEGEISSQLGLKVTIDPQRDDSGQVTIHYSSMMELDSILRRLG